MAITAIGSVATWVTPLQIAHGVMGIHSAGARSIDQVIDHACKAIFVKSRFEYKRAYIMPPPASGHVPLLSMTKTSMMQKLMTVIDLKPIWQSGLSRSTYPFPQDLKRSPV